MSQEPTVFEPINPIGKCGACGRDLYPHSSPNICDYKENCPMHGERWLTYQAARRMQNSRIVDYEKFRMDGSATWQA